jgi:branched-subunit amino acid aminotransferase/4-amino-4-deoxychorismate lyase
MIVYFNGKYIDENKVSLSIKDRGFLLGDGVFETILYKNKKLIFFDLHTKRLKRSLKRIFINFNESKSSLSNKINKLIKRNNLENDNLSIRITITRGKSERGIDILPNSKVFLLITSSKIKNNLRMKPLKLSISNIIRNETSITSKYKTINYLDNIIAKHEAIRSKFDDVLFINSKNNICCSSTSNFFYRENKKIFTPPIQDGVLDGTIREILIAKRKVAVKSIKLNNLKNCKEVFITNSLFGIRPVEKIEKFNFNIGQDTYDIDKFLSNLGNVKVIIMFSTIAREYKYIRFFVKLLGRSKKLDKNKSLTVPDMIEESIDKFPNNIAIEFEDKSYTYSDLDKESNQVANWAIKKGYKTGDVVALLMENKPEFIFIWLGLSKLGITIACLNNNIKSKSLAHCIQTSKSKSLILSSDLIDNYSSAEDLIDDQLSVYVSGDKVQGFENIDDDNEKNTNRPNSSIRKTLTNSESLFYIYTSGTTGLPKASNFSHQKFAVGSGLQMFSLNMKSTDKTYLVLPLYHATGGVVGLGSTLFTGGTVVLRKKFSVEKFWEDCAKYNVTVITYIGELFRYLISAPKNEFEKAT